MAKTKSKRDKDGVQRIEYGFDMHLDRYRHPSGFTEDEKLMLRPIAETLAMLDGNAFFTMGLVDDREWYEQYLSEAWEIWEANGGINGWAGEASWAREHRLRNENRTLKGLHEQYRTALALTGNVDGYDGI